MKQWQIEHHLFPQVCTDRLALLVPTVRQTCKEFNVKVRTHTEPLIVQAVVVTLESPSCTELVYHTV
jgi:hypothetical protein